MPSSADVIVLDGESSGTENNVNNTVFEQCTAGAGNVHSEQWQMMSKSQRKKRERMERYAVQRKERRRAHRERRKERKRTEQRDGGGTAKAVDNRNRPTKLYTMNESKCRIRVAVDMAYDELMDERTVRKTVSQLRHCYAANRRATDPLQFYVVNVDGKCKKVLDGIAGTQQWDAHLMGEPLNKLWDDNEIVYLTADSDNTLNELDKTKVYIIGGLLDHNHHKGLCLRRAIANGYAHAKLPIGDFVRMSTRKVLAINHVFEILLHFTRDHDWERAFLSVIPKRKLAQPVEGGGGGSEVVVELDETNNNTSVAVAGGCDGEFDYGRMTTMDESDRQELRRMIDQIDDREEEEEEKQSRRSPPSPTAATESVIDHPPTQIAHLSMPVVADRQP